MSKTTATPNYGAVEEGELDRSFDVNDTYYLPQANLTPDQRRRKCINVLVPLLAAVLIVGGAAFFLLSDFGHLYPGSGGDPRHYSANQEHHGTAIDVAEEPTTNSEDYTNLKPRGPILPASSSSSTTTTSTTTSDTSDDSAAACSVNLKCAALNLTGACCPTQKGENLSCC